MFPQKPGLCAACLALLCSLLLAACSASAPGPTPLPAPTYPPIPTLTRVVETPLPPALAPTGAPTEQAGGRVFPTLVQALPSLDFAPLVPAYIPDGLPLARIWLSAQGELVLFYSFSGQSPETSPRLLTLTQSTGGEPVTAANIFNPERGAVDVLPVDVRGQQGFLYWTYAGGGRPSYRLAWREQNANLTLALTGSWASGSSTDPHSLDPLLLMVASGLVPDTSTWQSVTTGGPARPITFSIPADWKPDGQDSFAGADGFARLEIFDGPETNLIRACEWEANTHPDWYGVQPELSLIPAGQPEDAVCLVRPDSGQGAVLIPNQPGARPLFYVLRVNARHALAAARSLSLPPLAAPVEELAAATTQRPPAAPQVLTWQGLSVEIYPLGSPASSSPDVFFTAPPEALEKRREAREQPAPPAGPVTVNGRSLALRVASIQHPFAENGQVQVSADGQVIYRYNLLPAGDVRDARLFAWEDQWVVNINGLLVINGEAANPRPGAERIDGWTLLSGKPFYYAQQDGQMRVSYGGAFFPLPFDRLLENFPRGSNERMAWFYALKDGQVMYVEMGRY